MKEIKKILCLNKEKFQKIKKALRLFFQGFKGRPVSRSSLLRHPKGQKLGTHPRIEPLRPQSSHQRPIRSSGSYEPSNIINAYNSDFWRWRRVKEWFNQYAQDDKQGSSEKNIIKQLKE